VTNYHNLGNLIAVATKPSLRLLYFLRFINSSKRLNAICGSYSTYTLKAYFTLTQTEFLHSSPEALRTPSGVRDLY
jgi:hypothetical protein